MKIRGQYHILRPLLIEQGDAIVPGAIAECDRPNRLERVDVLRRPFVEDFGNGVYRAVGTGEIVEPKRVCMHCARARARRAVRAGAGDRA